MGQLALVHWCFSLVKVEICGQLVLNFVTYSFEKVKHSLPIPCLGFGLSAGGFWNGTLIGTSVTSYLTLNGPSEASVA